MRDFMKFVKEQELVFIDGAMGTELFKKGLKTGDVPEIWNVEHPEAVLDIQRSYVDAGAQILITNTFGGNRLKLKRVGEEKKLRECNQDAVKIARKAAGEKAFVVGDIGPTGEFLEPYGTHKFKDFYDVFLEQANALAEVDLFIIETMADTQEVQAAIRACKENFDLPVIASMSFDRKGDEFRTMMGVTVQQAAEVMDSAGADVIGTNCGSIDPTEMAVVIKEMRNHTTKPLIAEPNAGRPALVSGKASYKLSPQDFVEGAKEIIAAGAKIIGGCCGTGPEHIKLLREFAEEGKS